jgi:uncharacterized SAM-binding protein YcdF (DUF218 family)
MRAQPMRLTEWIAWRRIAGVVLTLAAVCAIPLWLVVARAGTLLVVRYDVSEPDAIVILASHEWERLPEAARLAQHNPTAVILLTQPVAPNGYNCAHCPLRDSWLRAMGVTTNPIVVLPRRVRNTYDEAVAAREYAVRAGYRRVMVVTSPYHTRRALAAFVTVFKGTSVRLGVLPVSSGSVARPKAWLWDHYDRSYVAYEWTALVWYRLKYGVMGFG